MGAFFGIFALLLVTGVPVALALGIGGIAFLWLSGNEMMILQLPQRMMAGVNQFVLLTIPLFLLAGTLMNAGGITDRIVQFARVCVGHRRGGMSSVTVLSAGFFAGISGSANAEAAALGSVLIPTMRKQGIPGAYAAALVGVASIVGPIIPPSITMIIYGVLSGTSIGQLFMAGVVPGILLVIGFLIYAGWRARRDGFPVSDRVPMAERGTAIMRAMPALFLPVIIIVGIKGGVFTPTEAAAVAVVYALIVGFGYGDLGFRRIWESLVSTAIISASILFITAMGSDQNLKNEIDPAVLASAGLYVADRIAQTERLGELRSALEAGHNITPTELGDIITGKSPGRTPETGLTLCDLTGTGAQDTAIAAHVLPLLEGAGTLVRT